MLLSPLSQKRKVYFSRLVSLVVILLLSFAMPRNSRYKTTPSKRETDRRVQQASRRQITPHEARLLLNSMKNEMPQAMAQDSSQVPEAAEAAIATDEQETDDDQKQETIATDEQEADDDRKKEAVPMGEKEKQDDLVEKYHRRQANCSRGAS